LTASLAIAEHVRELLGEAGLPLQEKDELPRVRMPNIGELAPRPYEQLARIEDNADYGRIVCFCERVTRGEILDALASPIPPVDLDGLRRRTRVLMGRCQGFYCGAEARALLGG
jgi:glycerol-3-phosphate dehydrogenase